MGVGLAQDLAHTFSHSRSNTLQIPLLLLPSRYSNPFII